jgi:hypothetical protein
MHTNRSVLFVLLIIAHPSLASTINWFSDVNSTLVTSSHVELGTRFSFEIGSFELGFVPTFHNTNQWADKWMVFDRAFDPTPENEADGDPRGWNTNENFFVGAAEHLMTGASDSASTGSGNVFTQGMVAYLWVYNSKSIVPSSEWALVTDNSAMGDTGNDWIFPDPFDPPGTSYEWKLGDADLAVVGAVNGNRGEGTFTVHPGTYHIQTHVVPEPSSLLLVALVLVGGAVRRKRN